MKERPKNAWLITWLPRPGDEFDATYSKVVTILPSKTPSRIVKEIVKAIYVTAIPLNLCEKFHFGLDTEQRSLLMHDDADERFLYGTHELLLARKVKNLERISSPEGYEELRWTEVEYFKLDPETGQVVRRQAEREDSYREYAIQTEG